MSSLRPILARLINAAAANPGRTQSCQLPGGTEVSITIDAEKWRYFALARIDAYPTRAEWNTFLEHWPTTDLLPSPRPTPLQNRSAYEFILKAKWPKPDSTVEKTSIPEEQLALI